MTSKQIQKIEEALNERIYPNQRRYLRGKTEIYNCRSGKLKMTIIKSLIEMESILVIKGSRAHTICTELKAKMDKSGLKTANIVLCTEEKKNNV